MFIIIPYRVDEAGWKFGGAKRDKGKRLRCLREGRKKRGIGVTRVTNFAFCTLSLSRSVTNGICNRAAPQHATSSRDLQRGIKLVNPEYYAIVCVCVFLGYYIDMYIYKRLRELKYIPPLFRIILEP